MLRMLLTEFPLIQELVITITIHPLDMVLLSLKIQNNYLLIIKKSSRNDAGHYRQVKRNLHNFSNEIVGRVKSDLGVYRLSMKSGSDNYRSSSIIKVIEKIREISPTVAIKIYEPSINSILSCIAKLLMIFK